MIYYFKKVLKSLIPQSLFLQKIYRGIYYLGIWGMNYGVEGNIHQTGELNAIKRLRPLWDKENPVLFDVGANVGDYTKFLCAQIGSKGKIYSFEPLKHTFIKLQSISLPNVHLQNLGLSNEVGEEIIYFHNDRPSHASLVKLDMAHFNLQNDDNERIQVTTLDFFCTLNHIDRIDLLKIDVEGHEIKVFQGAKRLLEEHRIRTIQFEFGATQIDAKVFFKDFWHMLHQDFKIYRVLKNNLYEIKFYTESLEIFHFSNFIAIHKNEKP